MMVIFFLIFLSILRLLTLSSGQEIREFYAIKESGSNISFSDEYLIQTVDCASKSSALRACVSKQNCVSYLFNKDKESCVLFRNKASVLSDHVYQGLDYYDVKEGICPEYDGYIYDKGTELCIKYYTMKSTYDQAVSYCGEDRATLVRIDSDEKWQFIKHILDNVAFSLFYVQGRYRDGLFVYDDDDRITFIKWASLPPEANGNNRLIISKDDGYKWHAVRDSSFNGFLCQKFVRPSTD